MPPIPNAQLTHAGLFVNDMDRMVAFYTGLLGMQVSDSGYLVGKHLTFLTRSIHEHHQLVLVAGRTAPPDVRLLSQLSFRVDGLDELRYFHAQAPLLGASDMQTRSHGNSWSIYFRDPEGNIVEMYCGTPWQVHQPWRGDLDFGLTNEVIEQQTLELIEADGVAEPIAVWQQKMAARLAAVTSGEAS
jgi:catechol 2,3-dioxygenase